MLSRLLSNRSFVPLFLYGRDGWRGGTFWLLGDRYRRSGDFFSILSRLIKRYGAYLFGRPWYHPDYLCCFSYDLIVNTGSMVTVSIRLERLIPLIKYEEGTVVLWRWKDTLSNDNEYQRPKYLRTRAVYWLTACTVRFECKLALKSPWASQGCGDLGKIRLVRKPTISRRSTILSNHRHELKWCLLLGLARPFTKCWWLWENILWLKANYSMEKEGMTYNQRPFEPTCLCFDTVKTR